MKVYCSCRQEKCFMGDFRISYRGVLDQKKNREQSRHIMYYLSQIWLSTNQLQVGLINLSARWVDELRDTGRIWLVRFTGIGSLCSKARPTLPYREGKSRFWERLASLWPSSDADHMSRTSAYHRKKNRLFEFLAPRPFFSPGSTGLDSTREKIGI